MSVRLKDVIEALKKRGEDDWAEACMWVLPLQPMIEHGFAYEEVLNMTINEIEAWDKIPAKPLKYEGWNFWWGLAA